MHTIYLGHLQALKVSFILSISWTVIFLPIYEKKKTSYRGTCSTASRRLGPVCVYVRQRVSASMHQTKALPWAAPIKYDNAALSQQCLMDFLWVCLVIAWPPAPWPLSALGKLDEKHAAPQSVWREREREAPNLHMTEGRCSRKGCLMPQPH